jgi:serine/threonine protein kinase/tetratricopeptide (TPR) repeat protein
MAAASTNGRGNGEDRSSGDSKPSTHDSGPRRSENSDPNLDVLSRGATLGRYLILERLGAGAMGVVYAAYDPELDRKVAIKILRPHGGGDQDRRRARLVREAKAVARVSHPNVVGIFDVGVHDGQVFLAMEYLTGGTLSDWLAAEKRAPSDITRMFIEVAKGLAGAHAEGLIHRDFKPDNVLIDKNGVPKVVDFGLVRLSGSLESSASDLADTAELGLAETSRGSAAGVEGLTRTGALAGTPAYMAPEQFLGEPVGTFSDQFAFCVALYEALYGGRPFAGKTLISLADSVTAGVVSAPPKDAHVSAWMRRLLLRGLAADPSQRFPSMQALAAALGHDPARRKKQWMLVGATLLTMLALVGVTVRSGARPRTMCTGGGAQLAGIWEPGSGESPRKAAIRSAFVSSGRSYAQQAYAGAARLLDQYVERWTGMYAEACQATQVRGDQSAEVMDLRMACLRERLGNARALSDVFAAADGQVVENAVSAAAALPSLDRCADVPLLRAVVKPPEDPATRKRVDDLRTELAKLIALRDSGQCARAMPKADALISDVRRVGYQPLLAETLFASAQIGVNCGDAALMLERLKEAHEVAVESRNDDVAAQAAALIPPFAINRLGQVVVAREWLVVARGDVARFGRGTLADAMLAQADGMLAWSDQQHGRALEAADRSIAITQKVLGPDDPLTIQWKANKGNWLEAAGHLDEALKADVQAREDFQRVLGREHPRVAYVWSNEGDVLYRLGRYAEAATAYQGSARLFRQSGADAEVLAWVLTGLGRAFLGKGEPAAAVAPLEEALTLRIEKKAPSPQLGETRWALARALWSRPPERRRSLALGVNARDDYGDDKKAVAEIDAWLARARTGGAR